MMGKYSKYLAIGLGALLFFGGIGLGIHKIKSDGPVDSALVTIDDAPVALSGGDEDDIVDPPAEDPPENPPAEDPPEDPPADPDEDPPADPDEDPPADPTLDTPADPDAEPANGTDGDEPTEPGEGDDDDDDDLLLGNAPVRNTITVSESEISIDDSNLKYTGSARYPSVKYNGSTLSVNSDYTISCSGGQPVDAGNYVAIITLTGKYECDSSIERSFTIAKGTASFSDVPKPEINVQEDKITLTNLSNKCQYQIVAVSEGETASASSDSTTYLEFAESIVKSGLSEDKSYAVYYRVKETDNYTASEWKLVDTVELDVATTFNPRDVIQVDYKNEMIKLKSDQNYELALSASDEDAAPIISDLSSVINRETFEVYVRSVRTVGGREKKSEWQSTTVKGRPAKPVVKAVSATSKTAKDGKFTSEQKGLEYKLSTAKTYTTLTDTTKVAAGTYLVRVAATSESFASLDEEVIIEPGAAVATATKKPTANKLTYNGAEQALVSEGTTKEGTIKYSTSKDGEYSTSIPKAKNAGSYKVYWKIVADSSHKDSTPATISVTISKKQLTVSGTITAKKKYDGTTKVDIDWNSVKLSGVVGGDQVSVTGTAAFENATAGTNKKIKISSLKLQGSGKDNYSLKTTSLTGTGTIEGTSNKTGVNEPEEKTSQIKKSTPRIATETTEPVIEVIEVDEKLQAKIELKERLMEQYQSALPAPRNLSTFEMIERERSSSRIKDETRTVAEVTNTDEPVPLAGGQSMNEPYVVLVVPTKGLWGLSVGLVALGGCILYRKRTGKK